jgi:hypothetical protein
MFIIMRKPSRVVALKFAGPAQVRGPGTDANHCPAGRNTWKAQKKIERSLAAASLAASRHCGVASLSA